MNSFIPETLAVERTSSLGLSGGDGDETVPAIGTEPEPEPGRVVQESQPTTILPVSDTAVLEQDEAPRSVLSGDADQASPNLSAGYNSHPGESPTEPMEEAMRVPLPRLSPWTRVRYAMERYRWGPIKDGCERITWTAPTGRPMHADIQEIVRGGARELEADLRAVTGAAHTKRLNQNALRSSAISAPLTAAQAAGPQSSSARSTDCAAGPSNAVIPTPPDASQQEQMYLMLVVSIGRSQTLRQLDVRGLIDDKAMFEEFRTCYNEVAKQKAVRWWWCLRWLFNRAHHVKEINFVSVSRPFIRDPFSSNGSSSSHYPLPPTKSGQKPSTP